MDEIGERFLELVYDEAQGSPDRQAPGAQIGEALGLDEAQAAILGKRIADEGYLKWFTSNYINLTAAGIARIQATRAAQ